MLKAKYKIVSDIHIPIVEKWVSRLLEEDWELVGGLVTAPWFGDGTVLFAQAMVIWEEEDIDET